MFYAASSLHAGGRLEVFVENDPRTDGEDDAIGTGWTIQSNMMARRPSIVYFLQQYFSGKVSDIYLTSLAQRSEI